MTLRLGLIAASRIAEGAVVRPAIGVDGVEVVAVAARSEERAREAAHLWNLPQSFGSYEALLASDEIDAVYIATPAALHREWSMAAIEAGKHVMCEKPFAANAEDARAIAAVADASEVVVMEAFHWRYHPLVQQMRLILDSGVLGDIEHVDAFFEIHHSVVPPGDIRWILELGGGAMMDIGCYPVSWVRWVLGTQPTVVSAEAECPVPEVDGRLDAELAWPSGVSGSLRSSMISSDPGEISTLRVMGSKGEMLVGNLLAPQNGSSLVVDSPGGRSEYPVDRSTTYHYQLEAFRDAVEHGAAFPTTANDAVLTMEVIDNCYLAAGLDPRPTHL